MAADRMSPLSSVSAARAVLEAHGLQAKYTLGQNFLVNDDILRKIIELAQVGPAAQGLRHRQVGEHPAALRHQGHPLGHDLRRGPSPQVLPVVEDGPPAAGTRPMMDRRVVDFPAPLAPMRVMIFPSGTSKETSRTAWMPP